MKREERKKQWTTRRERRDGYVLVRGEAEGYEGREED